MKWASEFLSNSKLLKSHLLGYAIAQEDQEEKTLFGKSLFSYCY